MCENKGLILILNVTIDAKNFVLINLHNPNTSLSFKYTLTMMKNIDINKNSDLLLARDFNVFLIQI